VEELPVLIDYHVHTSMSGDAKGDFSDYLKAAHSRGLSEIGFSDHYHVQRQSYSMSPGKLNQYAKSISTFREKTDLPVKLGLEVDYIPGFELEIEKALKSQPFDYVIGSVHFIDGWSFDDPRYISEYEKWDIAKLMRTYFRLIQRSARSKLFDIIGHADLIKKFGFKPKTDITDTLTETIQALNETGVCVEVNTGGLRAPCAEVYPSQTFLEMCFESEISITLGSDAHTPENIGKDFDKALSIVKTVGYGQLTRFSHRMPETVEI
jgi:histidinol-phosphatase (PHP family)